MKTIKIIETPPGFAPIEIREQWVDVEMLTEEKMDDGSGNRTGTENSGGYRVRPEDAIKALEDAGKQEAADFWRPIIIGGNILVFKKECCEEV